MDDSLAKQELCSQWGSQAGAWESETKDFAGTGILPVRCTGWKPVPPEEIFGTARHSVGRALSADSAD
jgi:hypothetical protein